MKTQIIIRNKKSKLYLTKSACLMDRYTSAPSLRTTDNVNLTKRFPSAKSAKEWIQKLVEKDEAKLKIKLKKIATREAKKKYPAPRAISYCPQTYHYERNVYSEYDGHWIRKDFRADAYKKARKRYLAKIKKYNQEWKEAKSKQVDESFLYYDKHVKSLKSPYRDMFEVYEISTMVRPVDEENNLLLKDKGTIVLLPDQA
jgi:hypothetical protein